MFGNCRQFLPGENAMATRMWNTDADADDELADVDVNLAIGNYGQGGLYDDGTQMTPTVSTILMSFQRNHKLMRRPSWQLSIS